MNPPKHQSTIKHYRSIVVIHGWLQGNPVWCKTWSVCRDISIVTWDQVSGGGVSRNHNRVEYHYCDVIMSTMASQVAGVSIVCSIVCSGTDQRKHQSSASPAFVRGTNWWPVNSPLKRPLTRKMFPFDDVIMCCDISIVKWDGVSGGGLSKSWGNHVEYKSQETTKHTGGRDAYFIAIIFILWFISLVVNSVLI